MRHSLKRAVARGLVLPSIALGWAALQHESVADPFIHRPAFALRPGPIERPLALAAADFDRDGHDDLLIANYQAGTLQILLANGDGTYATPTGPFGVGSASIGVPTSGPFVLSITDLNPEDVDGDGVANASDNCPNSFNPIDSTTGKQPDANGNGVGDACEAGTDTDADGIIDVPIDTDGDGVLDFDPATLALDNCPRRPNPGQEDTDRAAGPDGICGTFDDNLLLYGADGLCGTTDDRVGDRIGDACALSPDILILVAAQGGGIPFGAVRVRLGDGEGGLVGRSSHLTFVSPGGIAIADFTGDHRPDMAVSNAPNGVIQMFPGQGDGLFGLETILLSGKGPQGLAAADLNGDGHPDLAVADRIDAKLSIFTNGGTGLPQSATTTVPTDVAPSIVLAGRLNADADDDLVVLAQGGALGDGSVQVFLGSPAGTPTAGQFIALGAGHQPRAGLLRDLDGNGTLDLAVADFTGGQVLIFAGQGDGTFVAASTIPSGGQPADLAALDIDAPTPGGIDLAVLDFQNNRIQLYLNGGGLAFTPAPTTPASPWNDTSAMALFGADTLAGADIVLLQRRAARVDLLSGIGDGSFLADPTQTIAGLAANGAADVTGMEVSDFRFDNRPDIAALDTTAGRVTILANESTNVLQELKTYGSDVGLAPGVEHLGSGTLVASIDDFDRDGIPNVLDDCPAVYNPRCDVKGDFNCLVQPACTVANLPSLLECDPAVPATLDPVTGQCDSDRNGIGDHCQVVQLLAGACVAVDSDFDLRADYDPAALPAVSGGYDFDRDSIPNVLDNCPTIVNPDQADANANGVGDLCELIQDTDEDGVLDFDPVTLALDNCPAIYNPGQEDNDNDRVGNACIVTAALDNCPFTSNSVQTDTNGDGIGDGCAIPPQDLLAPNPVTGEVVLLSGDASGALRPAAASPLTGLAGPTAALPGHFTLSCLLPNVCLGDTNYDVVVAERGVAGNFADDRLTVFRGDGFGGFSPLPPAPAAGDPNALLLAIEEPVCGLPGDPLNPSLRLDADGRSDVLVAVEPGASALDVYVVSNQNILDPSRSPLVHPTARPAALPVPPPLRAAAVADVNFDGRRDLVALSSPPGGPSVVTVFIALGNGLFFTDPSLDPAPIAGEAALMTTGNVNLKTDLFNPEVVLFNLADQAPIVLTNIVNERADIDGSGRVDGFDLALLAASFGASRGEDFTILPDDTLLQTGTGVDRRVVGRGSPVPGQELPGSSGACNNIFDPLSGTYGLPVDVNLDGIVDGKDLAFLASLFGRKL